MHVNAFDVPMVALSVTTWLLDSSNFEAHNIIINNSIKVKPIGYLYVVQI